MDTNPYQVGEKERLVKTRATRWMLVAGVVLLVLAVLSFLATVVGLWWSFSRISNAPNGVSPAEVAGGIRTASIPSLATIPLAVVGLAFLVLGIVRRQPCDEAGDRSARPH